MPSDLINIGRSGALAARAALDVTAQNIANANSEGYSRRSVALAEVRSTGSVAYYSSSQLSGVRVEEFRRSDSIFLQNEARRTGSDAARADAELAGLRSGEQALEQAQIFPAIVEFEAALGQLRSDPLNEGARAVVLENGRGLADSLRIADSSLAASGEQIRGEAAAGVDRVNTAASELARLNVALGKTQPGTTAQITLLDQRDAQLGRLSDEVGIAVSYEDNGTVSVQIGNNAGPTLVQNATAGTLALTNNPDGTVAFTLDGAAADPITGGLAGKASALAEQRDLGAELDGLAAQIITAVNDAQANGTAPDGTAGQPFFSGSDAGTIGIALSSGAGIATAPAGAPAGSRDTGNLDALRASFATGGPPSEANRILLELSSIISSRTVTRDALATVAQSADSALARETAVDLNEEATNLVRFQQAFQASGRIIQTASEIFNTVLGLGR